MADPLSITVGAIGVVAATAHSIHEAIELVNNIKDAPQIMRSPKDELDGVEAVVHSLEETLSNDGQAASWTPLLESSKLSGALKTLKSVCDSFNSVLLKWTKHSQPGDKLSFRDGVNIAIHSGKIEKLSTQLNSCKQTVTMALGSCTLKSQAAAMKASDRMVTLMTQEKESTRLFTEQRADIARLLSEEQQLKLVKTRAEEDGDIEEMDKVDDQLRDVSRARMTVNQFATVSEYIAKTSVAARTHQDIGNVVIAEMGYGVVGTSNVDKMAHVKQKIGDVSVGKAGTGFVGIHNNVDHNAALANRWRFGGN